MNSLACEAQYFSDLGIRKITEQEAEFRSAYGLVYEPSTMLDSLDHADKMNALFVNLHPISD